MANDIHYSFNATDIKGLIDKGAAYIVASSHLEETLCDGRKIISIVVTGEGYTKTYSLVGRVSDCPCPPCNPGVASQYK